MQFMSDGFNTFKPEWFNSCVNVDNSKDMKKFKHKYEH
jgi:hypothetical protein